MAKNYFDRYMWLMDTINRHGYIKFEDISRKWAFSAHNVKGEDYLPERTFFNHIDAILSIFGIEIKCNRTKGYYIANREEWENDGIRKWMLQSLSLNNMMAENRDLRDRILFESIPSSQKWLTTIVSAIRDRKTIEMTYQSFYQDEPSTFEAHPWCLKLFKQRWYMLARSGRHKEPRVYSLDRIHEIRETENDLKVPKNFNASTFFNNFFGIIINEEKPVKVVLRVDEDQVKYLRSLPLHDSQKETETTDCYSVFEFRLVPTFDFKQEILRHGPSVEVLEPKDFREEIRDDVKAMLERYD